MPDEKVSYHDVCAVADNIFARGELPTVTSVQKVLSNAALSEIAEHLKEWENQKSANPGVLDGTNHTPPAASLAVQNVMIQTQNNENTPENSVFDTVVTHQNEDQTHTAMAELVKENRILAEKITQVTNEKNTLAAQLKKLQDEMQALLGKYQGK